MYAIIETGGKQYKVSSGDTIKVDRIALEPGSTINMDKILAVMDGTKTVVGTPYVSGASVKAEVMDNIKAKKIIVFKQKPRKGYRKLRGHRQQMSVVKIKEVNFGG